MLADGEHGEAGLVGELGGSQDFLQALLSADGASIGPVRRPFSEGIESDLHQAGCCSGDTMSTSARQP
jgi:hypothetical protein